MVLHRQGQLWAPGPNVGVQPPVPAQPGVEDVGVREDVGGDGNVDGGQLPPTQALPAEADLPSMEVLHSTWIPTHKWCPKAARGEFARELGSLWRRLCENPDDVRLWCLEAMFARAILPAGRGPREADAYSQARVVKERLRRWRGGEHKLLWEEAVQLTKQPKKKSKKRRKEGEVEEEDSQLKRNAERATVLAQEGQYTRALQALTSAGMASDTRATREAMKAKHPPARGEPQPAPTTDYPQISFSQEEVEKAARKFRRGSAPGPSGMRPEHLTVILQSAPGRRNSAVQELTRLVTVMAGGAVPQNVAPYLCGARLHAAAKKSGGIRPIAVGNLLRRLVGKCAATKLQDRAAAHFSPHQLGVGVRGGCEAIVHTVRRALDENPDLWCLQADFQNAFNLIDRGIALEEVERVFPEVLAWVTTCYGQPSQLLFGETSIWSQLGVHQGDPLAALIFSLVLHPLVLAIQERVPTIKLNAWYLDDGTMVGKVEELEQVVDILVQEGPARGLVLSTAATVTAPDKPKTTVWSPAAVGGEGDPLAKGLERVKESGITLLGAPVGSQEFMAREVKRKVEKVEEITGMLPLLQDAHTEFVLLRSCLGLPKISFTLRTTDTSGMGELLGDFDRVTREGLTRILGAPLSDQAWQQAKLPTALGGMGLRGAVDHAPAAFAASVFDSKSLSQSLLGEPLAEGEEAEEPAAAEGEEAEEPPLVLPPPALAALSATLGENITEEELMGMRQRKLGEKVDLHLHRCLLESLEQDQREKARLSSLTLPHVGDWLNVAPVKTLGLHLRSAEFVLVAKYRLGLPVFAKDGPCPACLRPSDALGDHAMCCGFGGERISRHNHLRDALYETAVAAGLGPVKEGRALLPGDDRRPADILVPNWAGGRDAAMDVTVVTPLQTATVAEAAVTPGYALTFAYQRKIRGAAEDCRREGIAFLPLVVESLGGWHSAAEAEVRKLGAALARQSGQEESEVLRHLWGRLGLLLQRGNAAILGNRLPTHPPPAVDGFH